MTDDHEPREADDEEIEDALADFDPLLAGQLRELLDPGDLVRQRTAADVDRTLRSQNAMGTAADLLGTGWRTLSLLLTDGLGPADRDDEGR